MPTIKSAKKRVKVSTKATIRNRKTKRSVKSSIKALHASLAGDKKHANELKSKAQSEIDTAVKKGVLHKNKANRKKSQLARLTKQANIKPTTTTTKKTTTSKPKTKASTKRSTPKATGKTTKSTAKAVPKKTSK